jgi:hypothetical protein
MSGDSWAWCTVDLRLMWLPTDGHDAVSGQVVLHRTVDSDGAGPVSEFWISPVLDPLELLGSQWSFSAAKWSRLVYGLPVRDIDGPAPLLAADRTALAALGQRLSRPESARDRPLLKLHARARASNRSRSVTSARLVRADADVLSHAFGSPLRQTLHRLQLSATDREPATAPMPGRDAEPTAATLDRIRFEDVRGAQVGDHTVQVNRFIARAARTEVDFDSVLRRDSVVCAAQRLQQNPADPALRASLVSAIADRDWLCWARPVRIDVRAPQRSGFMQLLRGLLVLDVRGLQVGDHTRQVNEFVYVPSLPAGCDLLREHPQLARALADQICPRSPAVRDAAQLQGQLRETLAALPVAWRDGRIHNLHAYPPGEFEALQIRRADGVAIGHHIRQETSTTIELDAVTTAEHRLPTTVAGPRGAAERDSYDLSPVDAEVTWSSRTGLSPVVTGSRTELERAESEAKEARARAEQAETLARQAGTNLKKAEAAAERARIHSERAWARAVVARDDAEAGTERARVWADRAEAEVERTRADVQQADQKVERVRADADHARAKAERGRTDANRLATVAREVAAREAIRLEAIRSRSAQRIGVATPRAIGW